MLVSALNSHSEISCEHRDEDVEVTDGRVIGRAMKFLQTGQNNKKVIYLTRNKTDRLQSLERLGLSEVNTEAKEIVQRESLKDYIEISYEELTENKSITEIPEEYSNKICDYLGVNRQNLKTTYVKPDRRHHGRTKVRHHTNKL